MAFVHCPNCDVGHLIEKTHQRVLTTTEHHVLYPALYGECDYCHIELVSNDQATRNAEVEQTAFRRAQNTV